MANSNSRALPAACERSGSKAARPLSSPSPPFRSENQHTLQLLVFKLPASAFGGRVIDEHDRFWIKLRGPEHEFAFIDELNLQRVAALREHRKASADHRAQARSIPAMAQSKYRLVHLAYLRSCAGWWASVECLLSAPAVQ